MNPSKFFTFFGTVLWLATLCLSQGVGAQTAPNASAANAASADGALKIENSVVKIFSTRRPPDLQKPWIKASPQEISGSGVVIEGKLILTNAHVVEYSTQLQVQASQSSDKVSATVVAVAPEIDLAVLRLDDESFFKTRPAVPRSAGLPRIRDTALVHGFPTGGSSLSTTKGIVSRIEFVNYGAPKSTSGLRIQVDAAINPGNSGGPVMVDNRLIGLAFSKVANAQGIGYIIPNEEIELFLQDIKDGKYDGKRALLDVWQTLENPVLRDVLKLDKSVSGVVIHEPAVRDDSYPLKKWDVITHIGNVAIDNSGLVRINDELRVRFEYHAQTMGQDGSVALTIVRGGKTMNIRLALSMPRKRLIPSLAGRYPSYFIYGPIAFSTASIDFLVSVSPNTNALLGNAFLANPLLLGLADDANKNLEELVIVTAPFFSHKTAIGYSNRVGAVVYSVNDKPVRSLKHLVELLRDARDEFITIQFSQREWGESPVFNRKAMLDATEGILVDNGIRAQASEDLLKVWQSR